MNFLMVTFRHFHSYPAILQLKYLAAPVTYTGPKLNHMLLP